ncbi:Phosphotyrosine protein phosphatase I [Gracilaria domingensis]|nr:Phosphotyrosine protein phosphatase I [Gracilaria domingensis]
MNAFESDPDFTTGDAFREWILARDRGETAHEASDAQSSCAASRVAVLFVGRDNSTVSAAAEAIFTDLCLRRELDCFSCHSAGTRVKVEGQLPDHGFIEALRFKRGLDMSRKMACALDKNDLESYNLIVCMDEHVRSELLFMVTDDEGRYNDAIEERIVSLSSYCSNPKLRQMQFRSGKYSPDAINLVVAALVDACNGLLVSLIESPRVPPS